MKICVISTPVFALGTGGLAGYGGLEQIAWLCAKGLAEKGHEVTLIAPDGSECPGVTILPIGPAGQVTEQQAYGVYWKELLKFDVINDHTWQKWTYRLKMESVLKAPCVSTLHAPVHTMYKTLPPIEKPCFVCISQDQANHFEALHSVEARVAYNGVDGSFYKPLGLKRTGRYLFLARFSTVKSPDLAIEASLGADVGLDLIGDTSITNEPDYYQKCVQMASRQSHDWDPVKGKQCNIVGGVSRGETVFWYSQAQAMLHLCRHFREPFGLAPVEAQLCGAPVVCWKFGAVKETVRHGETGYLVSSMQEAVACIRELESKSEHSLPVMRSNCREWASQFSIDRMVSRYEELCHEAIEKGW